MITGPLVVAVAAAVGVLALLVLRIRDRRRIERGEARPTPARPTAARPWALYACALVIGPMAFFVFWILAFGAFGSARLGPVAAIPAWLALGLPPAIGCFLGWRLPLVERSRDRMLLAVAAPLVLLGYPYLFAEAGNYLALLGLAVLYAVGPVVIGRFLRLMGAVVRNRAA